MTVPVYGQSNAVGSDFGSLPKGRVSGTVPG